jgi:hypothetical protein
MSSTSNINPKPCNYGCNTRIYWDVNQNAYFEIFSQKRHICPNIPNNNKKPFFSIDKTCIFNQIFNLYRKSLSKTIDISR